MLKKLTGGQREKFDRLGELLVAENSKYNLTRIVDAEEVRVRHFEDSLVVYDRLAAMSEEIEGRFALVDVGSGAGFPGLALAIALPEVEVVSIEATGKKAGFQRKTAEMLGLGNFRCVGGRGEELAHKREYREKFDAVTFRAVGSLAMVAEIGAGFLKVGGVLWAWKGPKIAEEQGKGRERLCEVGMGEGGVKEYEIEGVEGKYVIFEAMKKRGTEGKYPREFKYIKRDS